MVLGYALATKDHIAHDKVVGMNQLDRTSGEPYRSCLTRTSGGTTVGKLDALLYAVCTIPMYVFTGGITYENVPMGELRCVIATEIIHHTVSFVIPVVDVAQAGSQLTEVIDPTPLVASTTDAQVSITDLLVVELDVSLILVLM